MEPVAGAVVGKIQVKIVVAQTQHGFKLGQDGYLILDIDAYHVHHAVIVGIGGIGPECDGTQKNGIGKGYRGIGNVKKPGVALITRYLAAVLHAGHEFMLDSPCIDVVQKIGLVEEILALHGIVIG